MTAFCPSSFRRRLMATFSQSGHRLGTIAQVLLVSAQSHTTLAQSWRTTDGINTLFWWTYTSKSGEDQMHTWTCFCRVSAIGCRVKKGGKLYLREDKLKELGLENEIIRWITVQISLLTLLILPFNANFDCEIVDEKFWGPMQVKNIIVHSWELRDASAVPFLWGQYNGNLFQTL